MTIDDLEVAALSLLATEDPNEILDVLSELHSAIALHAFQAGKLSDHWIDIMGMAGRDLEFESQELENIAEEVIEALGLVPDDRKLH